MADPTAGQRKMYAKMGISMPDGSYYVRNAKDLQSAIETVGLGTDNSHSAIRKHIIARANALHLSAHIPDTWNPDGSLKHGDVLVKDLLELEHFGVKGMHWGSRKGAVSGTPSHDHAKTVEIHSKVKSSGGIHVLSNEELKTLTERLNLEAQYSKLSPDHVSAGEKAAKQILGNFAKQQAANLLTKGAQQGGKIIIKKFTK